jgi:cytolysin-activating lysine-acyltransferase
LTKYEVLGHFFALAAVSPAYRDTPLWQLVEMFIPPIERDQYVLLTDGEGGPFAGTCWAWLSEEVAERYKTQGGVIVGDEYQSGDQLWFTSLFAPFGRLRDLLDTLREEFPAGTRGWTVRDDGRVLSFLHREKEAA